MDRFPLLHAGVNHSTVINNGTMLGVSPLRNGNVIGKLGNLSELGEKAQTANEGMLALP